MMARTTTPIEGRIHSSKTAHRYLNEDSATHGRTIHWVIFNRSRMSARSPLSTRSLPNCCTTASDAKGRLCCKSRFCTDDQKFCGLQARLSCKDVRDLIASRQLKGDCGNAIEVIRIGDCFPFRVFAKTVDLQLSTFPAQSAISDISQRSRMAALPAVAALSRHGNLCLKPRSPGRDGRLASMPALEIAPWKAGMETFSSLLGGKPNFLL